MNNLGILLQHQGHPSQAEYWYSQAANAGGIAAAGAMYNLGLLHQELDRPDQAERWYRQAAVIGHTTAMTAWGHFLQDRAMLTKPNSGIAKPPPVATPTPSTN
jgi:TPR repeat protein